MLAQEPELDDQQPQDTGQGNSAHDPPSESPSASCARPVPESDFDMIDFMHQSAAYGMQASAAPGLGSPSNSTPCEQSGASCIVHLCCLSYLGYLSYLCHIEHLCHLLCLFHLLHLLYLQTFIVLIVLTASRISEKC